VEVKAVRLDFFAAFMWECSRDSGNPWSASYIPRCGMSKSDHFLRSEALRWLARCRFSRCLIALPVLSTLVMRYGNY